LITHFPNLPNKNEAWLDLHNLTQDQNSFIRQLAVGALGTAFSHVPDNCKDQAWLDLHNLTQDQNILVRWEATYALGTAFSHVPDNCKDQAWLDLHNLIQDQNSFMRRRVTGALGTAFSHIPDNCKDQAWLDLISLTQDQNSSVQWEATDALEAAFSYLPDNCKDRAWRDLISLTQDQWKAADVLGTAFSHIPDNYKDRAWQDLISLTQDQNNFVRMYAFYSLGRASVFKATEANDNDALKKELEAAIIYFEKSSQVSWYSPARFCCPFYRSYLAITFQEANEYEVQKYLAEAKSAVGGSEIKDELLKAIENLAEALRQSQCLKSRSIEEISRELNAYRWYCNKAAEHMVAAEEGAPGAVRLMKKCNPVLDAKIQATILEIQEKAKQICQITRGSGTTFEAHGSEINKAAKALSIENIHITKNSLDRITIQLKEFCRLLPKGKRELVCSAANEIERATDFPEKLDKIELAFAYVGSAVENALKSEDIRLDIKQVRSDIKQVSNEVSVVNNKVDEIRYVIFKQKISTGNAISILTSFRTELEKLQQFSLQHPESSHNEEQLQELNKDLDDRFAELKDILTEKPSSDDIKIVLSKLDRLTPVETWSSKFMDRADKAATLLTYISFLHEAISVLRPG